MIIRQILANGKPSKKVFRNAAIIPHGNPPVPYLFRNADGVGWGRVLRYEDDFVIVYDWIKQRETTFEILGQEG